LDSHPSHFWFEGIGEEDRPMDSVHDDRFVVFIRPSPHQVTTVTDPAEQPVAACSTYGEASRIRQALRGTAVGEFVIRFVGATGGGD
jgi:hypothetical protein